MSPLPKELHQRLPSTIDLKKTTQLLKQSGLSTVCEEALCPNRLFCFSKKRATFLALGKKCSRNCLFCAVPKGKLLPPDPEEAKIISDCAKKLGLKHLVITMVTRDDLADGGASHLVNILKAVNKNNPAVTVEVLTSDFQGDLKALDLVLQEKPAIFNHNVETIQRLSGKIRDRQADYQRSLTILSHAKKSALCQFVKSGFMVGLGETVKEVEETIKDLHLAGCDIITIGQYLRPTKKNYPLKKYISKALFEKFAAFGHQLGVKTMLCHPLVRSSLNAEQML